MRVSNVIRVFPGLTKTEESFFKLYKSFNNALITVIYKLIIIQYKFIFREDPLFFSYLKKETGRKENKIKIGSLEKVSILLST